MAKFKIKRTLRKSGFKEPLQMAGIMLLFIVGVVSFPTRSIVGWFYKGESEHVFLLFDGIERLLFSIMMAVFVGNFGFKIIPQKYEIKGLLVVIPALIVAVNNFPFVAYFSGDCSLDAQKFEFISFAVWCLGVGLFEELSFRGIILPLCLIFLKDKKIKGKKRPVFLTVAVSSAVFALTHLINLLGGNIGGTIVQVGYTFLIGSMCGIVVAKTGNVLVAGFIHVVYNFCGMIIEYCGKGIMWTPQQIACTAIVGVIIGVYLIVVAIKSDDTPQYVFNMLGDEPTGVSSESQTLDDEPTGVSSESQTLDDNSKD